MIKKLEKTLQNANKTLQKQGRSQKEMEERLNSWAVEDAIYAGKFGATKGQHNHQHQQQKSGFPPGSCNNCGSMDHWANECPLRHKKGGGGGKYGGGGKHGGGGGGGKHGGGKKGKKGGGGGKHGGGKKGVQKGYNGY